MQPADLERLKGDLDGILAVVKKVPTELQEAAFTLILQRWLDDVARPAKAADQLPPHTLPPPLSTDLPQQFQMFMRANALTNEHIAKVFHPVGPGAQLVVSDVPGRGKASKQVSLALLIAVGQALGDGMFKCGLEDLRNLCLHYDSYDGSNFATNLRNNKILFKTFKKGEDLELSGSGMKKAGELVKSIATATTS